MIKYSAVIYLIVDNREVGVTHINDAFTTRDAAQRWIDNQLPSFSHYEINGGKLHSRID